ncbi:NADH-quinone oxidoreductase subunit G [Nakamurella flavida]|uniref:NADH-quinone oxidoreductase n=1 Tax=Nakamurella flavida TaxID=363630 RepID=A0A938YM84_9ACTN|nr:NADH-quinone oxidoreductase subunit G [Nakamurella flavida]MBM9475819.1 NADH-quinone oxidoreductase subunit G [Nakamurella flavida]MDP9777899.1 NADH-quinone oxidoreductase subunit G [Nakamurella flavida]
MTQVATPPAGTGEPEPAPPGHVRLTIDGHSVIAPKGELVIRAAERLGIAIPRFCDHPLLEPVGACRQCLVEVEMGGRPMPKPQASCTQTVADGMVVRTQLSSPVAEKAQRSNLEFLLLNHPLDCPICDKGGECPLQNQTLAGGDAHSRMHEPKRVFTKPIAVSSEILLDRERCVLCQRCTRFSDQIAGDRFIDLLERGSAQQIGVASTTQAPFHSYFSGNTIQICPVGALTSAAYRFRSRPFDLVSTPTVCEHCADGCALRTDHRSGAVTRRLASPDVDVNEEWNCDKGRFAFPYVRQDDRLTQPLVRGADGVLAPASWTDAMAAAARGLLTARDAGGVGVITGGRVTVTDAYAYAKFARVALRTNDIDFRVRPSSAEEEGFLARRVVGTSPASGGVTHTDLERAGTVLLVALEPEDESPIVFLRLRKGSRHGLSVWSVGPRASRGLRKTNGTWIPAAPGDEPAVLGDLAREPEPDSLGDRAVLATALRADGAVVLVGERAAQTPGLLSAVEDLVDATGARLAWIPRRAGDRGALETGAFPTLLPGGRPVADPDARAELARAWGVDIPTGPGRDVVAMLAAIGTAERAEDGLLLDDTADETPDDGTGLSGLLVGGVDLGDLPDPAAALAAVAAASFVVSLEIRTSAVTALADVVFPVAAPAEKAGAFLNWEGRMRPFAAALPEAGMLDEGRILDTLGVEMDVDLYTQTPAAAAGELGRLGLWSGLSRPEHHALPPGEHAQESGADDEGGVLHWLRRHLGLPHHPAAEPATPGTVRLASWRELIDGGRGLDGEPFLAGTARPALARIAPETARALGVPVGAVGAPPGEITVRGPDGRVTLPVEITTDIAEDTVWVPGRPGGRSLSALTGAHVGDRVRVAAVRADAPGREEMR